MPRLLNLGSGHGISIPPWYDGWEEVRLDMRSEAEPDLLMDVLELDTLESSQFHAAYGSHLLEHIYPFHLAQFFSGLRHVLTPGGFVEFRVPNGLTACKAAAKEGSLAAYCYNSDGGDIKAWDILYGYEPYQMGHGEPFVHHNAFDPQRLAGTLTYYGFPRVYVQDCLWEIRAVGCLTDLSGTLKKAMRID